MSTRITTSMLESQVARLNKMTNSPAEYSHRDENGKFCAHVGHYYLAGAYGGHKLERIVNESGGCTDVLRCGFTTKRELYNLISAYMDGIEVSKA